VKRVAILQSNYIPWRGYFDIVSQVDEFVLYDTVQFTKNDWRNRNRIRTAHGVKWLTIPVQTASQFGQTIAETKIAEPGWAAKHWRSLSQSYARAPFFDQYRERLADVYAACADLPYLSAVNRVLIQCVVSALELPTRILSAADYPLDGDRNERLVQLCRVLGAQVYVSGPSARDYLDLPAFTRAGIGVEFMDYSGYAPYPQVHGGFEPAVSVLDLLFNVGDAARSYLSPSAPQPAESRRPATTGPA
jgi:hypothetical protein